MLCSGFGGYPVSVAGTRSTVGRPRHSVFAPSAARSSKRSGRAPPGMPRVLVRRVAGRRSQHDAEAVPFGGGEPEQGGRGLVVAEVAGGDGEERRDVHREREASFVAGDHVGERDEPLERCSRVASGELDRGADQMDALDVGLVVVHVRRRARARASAWRPSAPSASLRSRRRSISTLSESEQVSVVAARRPRSGACGDAGLDLAGRRRRLGDEPQDVVEPLVDVGPSSVPPAMTTRCGCSGCRWTAVAAVPSDHASSSNASAARGSVSMIDVPSRPAGAT